MAYQNSHANFSTMQPKPTELVTLSTNIDDHAHDYLQVVIGLQGTVEFDINGKGNYMAPGQGCIITESAEHAFGGVNSPSDIFVLNFYADTEINQLNLSRLNEMAQKDYYFQLDDQLRQLINLLAVEIESNPDNLLLSQSCNHTIIALLNQHIRIFQSDSRSYRLDMEAINRYIEKHIDRKISVAQLAGCVFLSESQFHHLFKESVGVTPHQYVLSKRVEYAKKLMEHGGYSLSHVAHMSGFAGHSTFTHAFSKLVGISPSKYRKNYFS
ncbi:AraC family transcriptional regulator [Vibrio hannami]|uniref:helix-turn-helix domain-containing protein n=1 Tax=Vibrio hannami TaxID=2717094 RepID=UPI002410206A|nr:AraC family transcriptional regulator [Vibrio hannami]MDG3087778.1 AraC family transcriptional regulator [Vibrio hannami]